MDQEVMMTGKALVASTFLSAFVVATAWSAVVGNSWNSSSHGYGQHHIRTMPSIGYTSPVTRLRGSSFSRSVWVINSDRAKTAANPILAPKATIIHVGSDAQLRGSLRQDACAYEAGVCVIRAGN